MLCRPCLCLCSCPPVWSVSAYVRVSISAYGRVSVSAYVRVSISAYGRVSVSACVRVSVSVSVGVWMARTRMMPSFAYVHTQLR